MRRGFDCKDNEKWKVWEDYGEMAVNEGLMEQIKESNRKIYDFMQSEKMFKGYMGDRLWVRELK